MTIKISGLPDNLAGVAGTDEFHVNKALVSERKSAAEVATYVHNTVGALSNLNPVVGNTRFAAHDGSIGRSATANTLRAYFAIPAAETVTFGTPTLATIGTTSLDSTDGVITATQPDGINIGQDKIIIMTNATASSTVEVTTHQTSDPEIFTFNAVGEYVILKWMGTDVGGWITIDATATV